MPNDKSDWAERWTRTEEEFSRLHLLPAAERAIRRKELLEEQDRLEAEDCDRYWSERYCPLRAE